MAQVCNECFRLAIAIWGEFQSSSGLMEIRDRPLPFDSGLVRTPLPSTWGEIADFAPIDSPLPHGAVCHRIFEALDGRTLAVHRTEGNRLDITDPFTGELLTERGPTDLADCRTTHLPGFEPSRHHRGAGELAQLADGRLLRWKINRRD